MTHEDVMELTIPVMEEIFEGFDKNNNSTGSSSNSPGRLEGQAAIDFLISSGGKL